MRRWIKRFARGLYKLLPDKIYLKLIYYLNTGGRLSFRNPVTFNEKIQWLKVYQRDPKLTVLVDKYAVKEYVSDKIGSEYVIPTIGVWDHADNIDCDELPDQFVLKCTHDSGSRVICQNKSQMDLDETKNRLEAALRRNYYWNGREWPYKNVTPRIIAEPYMGNFESKYLVDYKLYVFSGQVKFTLAVTERDIGEKITFYDRNWELMPFRERNYPCSQQNVPKPETYEQMIEIAEKLAEGLIFARVDLYEISGKIYFGELTFFPTGGIQEFEPVEWNKILGDWIELPAQKTALKNRGT